MTAGMTTQKLDKSQVSLPRVGFGALLAATLLAGSLIGAAASAAISAATAQPPAMSITQPHGLASYARDSFRYSRPLSVAQPNGPTEARDGFGANLTIGVPAFTHQRGRFDLR